MLYSARKGGKPLYIVYVCSFFSFFPVWCGKRYVWECASDTFRPSPPPVTPQTPPEGGQGGGFDWSVSDPPQHAAAHRATGTPERGAKEKEGEHQRGGADALGASGEQNPPTHSSRGDFFFKKACCPRPWRGLCAGSTGESTPAEHSGADRARAFSGCSRGCV